MDRAEVKQRIRALLQDHRGPGDCIRAVELLARATGAVIVPRRQYDQTRVVRSIVAQLRREGAPIGFVQGAGGGYFWAKDDAELAGTAQVFHDRAMSSLRQERALKRIPFTQVLEQHRIEFERAAPDHDPGDLPGHSPGELR